MSILRESLNLRSPDHNSSPRRGSLHLDRILTEEPLLGCLLLAKANFRLIALTTGLAIIGTAMLSEFVLTKWFQATAVIRPSSDQDMSQNLNLTGGSIGQSVIGALTGEDTAAKNSHEYKSILESFDFTSTLLEQYRLANHVYRPSLFSSAPTKWRLYKKMQSRFDCKYDDVTGNMTLTFLDTDSNMAVEILGYYLKDLQNKIRMHMEQSTSAASEAIIAEAQRNGDPMLQKDLYDLTAQLIEQNKTAQAESDFAFTIIELPFVPDMKFSPSPIFDCLLVGFFVPASIFLFLVFRIKISPVLSRLKKLEDQGFD